MRSHTRGGIIPSLLIIHFFTPTTSWLLDLAREEAGNTPSGVILGTASLHSEASWLYELNTRMTDRRWREISRLDKLGLIYSVSQPGCEELPVRGYVSSWREESLCRGLTFLLQPLTITNSQCGHSNNNNTGDYYGLSCSHNRTAWCQREYKHDVVWPSHLLASCHIARTGLDKSRCYISGKLELTFSLTCRQAGGRETVREVTYHLLQDYGHARRSPLSRVRRALAANPPFFKRPHYNVNVREEGSKQHTVTTIQATDPQGKDLTYSMVALVDSRSQDMFAIDSNSGTITTNDQLDREFMDVHYLRIVATTNDSPQLTATTTVQINVEDVNDHLPKFEESDYKTEVRESVSVGSTVITVRATDLDTGKNADLLYTIKSQSSKPDVFRIEPKTGVITTRLRLDREKEASHSLVVMAEDQGPPGERLSASTTVTITVEDENDNYPQFTEKTYYVTVAEDTDWTRRPVIGQVRAVDSDHGLNAVVHYSIIGGNTQSQFEVNEDSGEITVTKQLDHENTKTYRLVIRAQDRGSPTRSNTTQVIISVDDVNDHSPKFYSQYFQEAVAENVPVGYSIVRIQAYDGDEGENARISYALVDITDPFPFAIDDKTGWLTTTGSIDRESQSSYQFGVEAKDNGIPPRTERATIIIQVQDRNDNDPTFQNKTYDASALETDPPGTAVISVLALDKDMDARVQYEITGGNNRNRFSITTQNAQGVISIAQPLDYQLEKRFILTISATDSGGRFDTATVYINVTDANTHRPTFENSPYSQNVFEDAPVGTTVLVVAATDKDVGENARITYRISEEEAGNFKIDPNTGAIMISNPLDREEREVFVLTVSATDNGIPQMSDTTDVEIVIVDVNDNKPMFTQPTYHGAVREDAIPGTSILEILATDRDQDLNGRIVYTFQGGNDGDGAFVVDPSSGIVRTARPLDRETVPYYELVALAVDRGTPQLSSNIPIIVDIKDINDNPPIFSSDQLEYFIKENSPIGSVVGVIEAEDPDEGENSKISYSIIGGRDADLFHLEVDAGKSSARLISNTEFDHETEKTVFQLLLRAESPPLRTDIPVVVKVQDQNDNSPQLNDFRIIFNNYENNFPTAPIGRIPAYDADAMDVLSYNITYGNNAELLILNSRTGEISLSPKLNTNVGINAKMGVSVFDGKNEVRSVMSLDVLLVTKQMMHNSVTLRLNNMTQDAFLSPLFSFFVDSISAVVPAPRDNIHVFSIKSDDEVQADILNVTFSISRPGSSEEEYLDPALVQHKIYLNLETLIRLSTIEILPFDDNICIREPCLNFEHCQTRLMFGSAKHFVDGESILFRSIHPVKTHSCQCPLGFTGEKNHYICNMEVDMCYSNPCQNQGSCISKEGGYTCVCQENYVGENCEISQLADQCSAAQDVCASPSSCAPLIKGGFICENCTQSPFYNDFCQLEARSFSNGAFLSLPSLTQRFKFNLQLEFATIQKSGLLLYNGRYNGKHDFISLSIENEGVKFMFSTGGEERAEVDVQIVGGVSDGEWHHVEVQYYNRSAVVIVDHCDARLALEHGAKLGPAWQCANKTEVTPASHCSNIFNSCHTLLDLTGPLQLGALPGSGSVTAPPLDGCIRNLKIDHKFRDFNNFVYNNGTLSGCPERREFCQSHPCQNNGQCAEGWGGYVCKCNQGWGGKDCSQKLKAAKRFAGSGFAIYDAGLYPIQLPWLNSLSFRTTQPDGLLMMMEVRKIGWSQLALINGSLEYSLGDTKLSILTPRLNDGAWHHASVKWMLGEIWLNVDYGQYELTRHTSIGIQGLNVGKVYVGGTEQKIDGTGSSSTTPFDGCIENVRLGSDTDTDLSAKLEHGVVTGCEDPDTCQTSASVCPANSRCEQTWARHHCHCDSGYVGDSCYDVCHLNPCQGNSTCSKEPGLEAGYRCECHSPLLSGQYCERETKQPCPANWWGYPVCGPCQCDVSKGFNPNCDKKTGECRCKDYHYQPPTSDKCLACKCFPLGSLSQLCAPDTGACECKPGVSGQLCDSCAHKFAEVTESGCQVVYKSCPKSFVSDVWWPRTTFGRTVEVECPEGSEGKAVRTCVEDVGWGEADLFNCTHREMLPLFQDLTQLQNKEIQMNSYLALKTARQLFDLTNSLEELYGADILLISRLLTEILEYENGQQGFNLSHKQERDFIKQIVNIASRILEEKNEIAVKKVQQLDEEIFVRSLDLFSKYGVTLARNLVDTYTNPFEIVGPNFMFGLDTIETRREGNPQSRVQLESNKGVYEAERGGGGRRDLISIPKYNHYMRDSGVWDNTKIHLPRPLLELGEQAGDDVKAIVSYSYYRTLPNFLPHLYHSDLVARWGSYFKAISSIISLSVYTVEEVEESVELTSPISLMFSVKLARDYPRSKPFCARWDRSDLISPGWTQEGCDTFLPDLWQFSKASEMTVNCSCYRVSSYAVLAESAAEGLQVLAPVLPDNIVLYASIASLIILFTAALAFSLLYGLATNTNSIHRFIVVSLFIAQLLFIIAAKYHHLIVKTDFACKIVAILLHYFWLSVFSWLLVDALHLQRMLTELRDINHGNMKFYVAMGFGIPAVIVGLSVGVRGQQYGNLHFCWLSLYDVSVWSMVGPLCMSLFLQICILFLAIRAAFTLKAQIEDFGNLRGLLLLNIGLLPLATGTWTCAFFLVNEDRHELTLAFSVSTLITSTYIFLGYVAFNGRVRAGIRNRYLVCLGKKLAYGETLNTSHGTISRSALAYRNSVKSSHRNIGISTASTTSRSTSKTNSTPYRSDYYSSSDVSKIYGSHKAGKAGKAGKDYQRETDSESDIDQRSLSLASSHTSDEDDPLEAVTSSETAAGTSYNTEYNTGLPPLHVSGSAGLQVNDQPISAQNTLQRHHGGDLRLPPRYTERLSALTTSDNDGDTSGPGLGYGYSAYPGYGRHPGSPGSQSEMSSEEKYVAMSPPHLLHQTYQQYSTSYSTTEHSDPTSSSLQPSDITQESQHIF